MPLLPSQHNPAPAFAGREGAVRSSSGLAHPAPFTAGCSYTGLCPSTLVLRARCGASTPMGDGLEPAWVQDLACCCRFLAEEQKGSGSPVTVIRLPKPARTRWAACAGGAGSTQACATGVFPTLGAWRLCRAGPLPRDTQSFPSSPGHLQEGSCSS